MRCAAWVKGQAVDPIGSAGSYAGFLLIEWPLPWPRDIGEVPALAPLVAALAGTGFRLQGVVPLFADEAARRAVLYRRPPGAEGFTAYERVERIGPADRLVAAAIELAATGEGDPDWARATVTDDVLICGHGKRDICCGSQGTALALDLMTDPARFGGTIRLWRTSHTGGHRFAPTAIFLPQGTAWAFLDADAARRIALRSGALADLLPRYRGCAGVASPALQALEREAFAEVGWSWLDHRRWGTDLGGGVVRLDAEAPDGRRLAWEAEVQVVRLVPVPECGQPIEAAKKSEPELRVTGVRAATPAG